MILNENQTLKSLNWPEGKESFLGNLSYTLTSEDFSSQIEISVSRSEKNIEIFYSTQPLFKPEEKIFFVQMFFLRENDNLVLDKAKTSPELKTNKDINDTLKSINDKLTIMLADNIKPMFFPTGVVNKPNSVNKLEI